MDEKWLDALDTQVRSLEVCWALAPEVDPEQSADVLEAVADRLRWLARLGAAGG